MAGTQLALLHNAKRIIILLAISSFIYWMFFTPIAKVCAAEDTANLTVTVSGEFGQKEGVEVDIFSLDRELVAQTVSDANGQARFSQLRPGEYTIELYYTPTYGLALRESWGALNVTLVSGDNEIPLLPQSAPVLLGGPDSGTYTVGDKIDLHVYVRQEASLPMRTRVRFLIDRDCQPPYDYVVQSEESSLSSTDLHCGTFSPNEPGDYYALIIVEAYYRGSWVTTYQTGWGKYFEVQPVQPDHGFLIVTVRDAGNEFEPHGQVAISFVGTPIPPMTASVTSNLSYELGSIPAAIFTLQPGNYTVGINYTPSDPFLINNVAMESAVLTDNITIEKDQNTIVDLREASIRVDVLNEKGDPVTNAKVNLAIRHEDGQVEELERSIKCSNSGGSAVYMHVRPNSLDSEEYLVSAYWEPYLPRIGARTAISAICEVKIEEPDWAVATIKLAGAPSSVNRKAFTIRIVLVIVGLILMLLPLFWVRSRRTLSKLRGSKRIISSFTSRRMLLPLGIIQNMLPVFFSLDTGGMPGLVTWLSVYFEVILITSGVLAMSIIVTMALRKP